MCVERSDESNLKFLFGFLAFSTLGIGATVGTVYSIFFTEKNIPGQVLEENSKPILIPKFPEDIQIMRRVKNRNDKSGLEIVLFQFDSW